MLPARASLPPLCAGDEGDLDGEEEDLDNKISNIDDAPRPVIVGAACKSSVSSPNVRRPSKWGVTTQSLALMNRSLTTEIDPELLRAVYLHRLLQGFGHFLRGSTSGGVGVDTSYRGFEYSMEVPEIDDFISHEWGSGRWTKFVALLCFYNGPAALYFSIALGMLVFVLELLGEVPQGVLRFQWSRTIAGSPVMGHLPASWPLVILPVAFGLVLIFGQRLRRVLPLQPRRVFLDKMCIDQQNEDTKAQAILSLAGVLKRTERLVVLWSPQYLTRLWCTYEVATWLHMGKEFRRDVAFVPVFLCTAQLSFTLGIYIFTIVTWFLLRFLAPVAHAAAELGVLAVVLAPSISMLRQMVWDLGNLHSQLRNFRVQETECFCCSNKHRGPETGQRLACDRDLVYGVLAQWFAEGQENAQDSFNLFMQKQVAFAAALGVLSPWRRYNICLLMTLPVVWWSYSEAVLIPSMREMGSPEIYVALFALEGFVSSFLAFPACAMVGLRLCSYSNRLGGEESLRRNVKGLLLGALVLLGVLASTLLVTLTFSATRAMEVPWPYLGALILVSFASVALFCWPWQP